MAYVILCLIILMSPISLYAMNEDSSFVTDLTVFNKYRLSLKSILVRGLAPEETEFSFVKNLYTVIEQLGANAQKSLDEIETISVPHMEKFSVKENVFNTKLTYSIDWKRKKLSIKATIQWLQIQQ